jgi:hypothetical protein
LTGAGDDSADAAQKRIRALQKKLRQIQQLKEKRSQEGMWVGCWTPRCLLLICIDCLKQQQAYRWHLISGRSRYLAPPLDEAAPLHVAVFG